MITPFGALEDDVMRVTMQEPTKTKGMTTTVSYVVLLGSILGKDPLTIFVILFTHTAISVQHLI